MIVPQLRAIQQRYGYLPVDQIAALAARLGEPLHRLHEVISFFPHFRLEPPPDVGVYVCRDQACHLAGGPQCLSMLRGVASEYGGEATVNVEGVSCLGRCDGPPAVLVEIHRKGQDDRLRIVDRIASGEYSARLKSIIAAHLEGRDIPGDISDRAPRHWRIDPYRESAALSADDSIIRQRYAAVTGVASALKQATDAAA